jgi:hypothetical protein
VIFLFSPFNSQKNKKMGVIEAQLTEEKVEPQIEISISEL